MTRGSKFRRTAAKVALVCLLSAIVLAVTFEFYLRESGFLAAQPANYPCVTGDPVLNHVFRKSCDGTASAAVLRTARDVVYHTNELGYRGHALMENRNGLAVDLETTLATGTAEREAARAMVARALKRGSTLGADKNYDVAEFVSALRNHGVTPHVARKKVGSAIDGRTTRHAGYAVSLRKRKRVEEIFGWAKTVGGLRKAKFIGLAKVKAQTVFTLIAYNLTRMATISGWRLNTV